MSTSKEKVRPIVWKKIEGYPGYQVSDTGRVRSFKEWNNTPLPRILRQYNTPNGGLAVGLAKDGVNKPFLVHRLVLTAFEGPCPEGFVGKHLDDDKTNNYRSNLCWAKRGQNE